MDTKFFDTLSETLTKTAKELSVKTEGFYGKQKLRGQILTEQRAAEKALAAIGKVIYDRYMDGEEMEEALADLCVEVKNHNDKIDSLREEIADKAGKKICPACGKNMDRSAAFCPSCGNAYPEPVEEEAEEEAEEIADVVEEAAESLAEAAEEAVDAIAGAADEVKAAMEEMVEEIKEEVTEE